MADLIPNQQSTFNQPSEGQPTVPPTKQRLEDVETEETSPREMNWLERIVLLVAVVLLALSLFNTAIAIYRSERPHPQQSAQ